MYLCFASSTMDEEPLYLNLNPVFSIWSKPLLQDEYTLRDGNWVIEKGCHKRYIMAHLDQTDIKNYRLGFLRKKETPPTLLKD